MDDEDGDDDDDKDDDNDDDNDDDDGDDDHSKVETGMLSSAELKNVLISSDTCLAISGWKSLMNLSHSLFTNLKTTLAKPSASPPKRFSIWTLSPSTLIVTSGCWTICSLPPTTSILATPETVVPVKEVVYGAGARLSSNSSGPRTPCI